MRIPLFKNKRLFEEVFTHRSYLNESKKASFSNERLEFLGDSILSFIVSSFIFSHFKDAKEGAMTSLRSKLTNTQTLSKIAEKLELGKYIKLSKGEGQSGGRKNKTILENTYEALVAGIYLDQGLEKAQKFVEDTLLASIPEILGTKNLSQYDTLKDPKSRLQEITQKTKEITPIYKILKEEGPDHNKIYTAGVFLNEQLLAKGVGHSKQEAEKEAAKKALENIKEY
jgi:ribonuclease-3